MQTREKGRSPDRQAVSRKSEDRIADAKQDKRFVYEKLFPVGAGVIRVYVGCTYNTRGLTKKKDRYAEDGSRETNHHKRVPPTELAQQPAQKSGQACADRDSHRIDTRHGRPAQRWKIIGEQRDRRGAERRFADADHHSAGEKRPEIVGKCGQARKKAPYYDAER